MPRAPARIYRYLWSLAVLALPLALLTSAVVTFRELQTMQRVYLRDRAATIAGRLETLLPERLAEALETLAAEEPGLVDIQVFAAHEETPERPLMDPIWRGQQLYQTREVDLNGEKVFRAYLPFHAGSELRIARIDLAASAADFLVTHARHNVLVASLSGLVLLLLSAYALWAARRTARLERRQLELEHLARLGELSAALAHEIRNPLGTIKGFAQLAAERADQAMLALLEPVLGEVRRLERLVTDLLLYGRPSEPAWRLTEWAVLCAGLEAYAREAIGARPIRFSCRAEPWRMRTDPDLLKQVLVNLIRNSVEALEGSEDGEVRLGAVRGPAGGLLISVEDNGPGLPQPVRARLFQPFLTTKATGTGLGLSIARQLASALGGQLNLLPVDPHGARAELLFPGMQIEEVAPGERLA